MKYLQTSLVTQTVKHLPTVLDTRVRSLGQEDLLEKGMTTYSGILAHAPQKTGAPRNISIYLAFKSTLGFPCGSAGKEFVCIVHDLSSIPGLGSSPGVGKSDPL